MTHSFTHRQGVRFRDLDSMGHVNHVVYLTYMEEGRVAYLRAALGDLDQERPFDFVLARAEVDYVRSARFGDTVVVHLSLEKMGRSSFTFVYELTNDDGDVLARARTVQVCIGRDGRPVPAPDDFREALERFESR